MALSYSIGIWRWLSSSLAGLLQNALWLCPAACGLKWFYSVRGRWEHGQSGNLPNCLQVQHNRQRLVLATHSTLLYLCISCCQGLCHRFVEYRYFFLYCKATILCLRESDYHTHKYLVYQFFCCT